MENEFSQMEQSWMDEQMALMNALGQIGQIVLVGGFILMTIMLALAVFFSDAKEPNPHRGVSFQPQSLLTAIHRRPGLAATVLRVMTLIVCLVAAVRA